MVSRPIISRLYGNPVPERSLNISSSCIVKRLALANNQRPPGSYAERPLGQTAGVLRFHSSLEGLTDKGALCSGNCSEQFRVSGDCILRHQLQRIDERRITGQPPSFGLGPSCLLWNSDSGESINDFTTIAALGRAYARSIPDVRAVAAILLALSSSPPGVPWCDGRNCPRRRHKA
jgi:hypothetical protein